MLSERRKKGGGAGRQEEIQEKGKQKIKDEEEQLCICIFNAINFIIPHVHWSCLPIQQLLQISISESVQMQ